MHSASLFLGFRIDEAFSEILTTIRPDLLALYIRAGQGMWLQEIEYEGQRYLGKSLGDLIDMEQLSLDASNVHSFLKKIAPNYPYQQNPLVILPLLQVEC